MKAGIQCNRKRKKEKKKKKVESILKYIIESMFCAISGKPPRTPVVSPVSKCIFEKELIEQYIRETGSDPISNAPVSIDQLIVLSQTPQQSAFTNSVNSSTLNSNYSIPNLLSTLQNEWDAIMLENFRLRKQLDAFTKQLSNVLYERDAAKIVASNTLRERDQLVQELNQLSLHIGVDEESQEGSQEPTTGLSKDIMDQIFKGSKEYVNITRKIKDIYAAPETSALECKAIYRALNPPLVQSNSKLQPTLSKSVIFSLEGNKICIIDGNKTNQLEINIESNVNYLTSTPDEEYILFSTANGKLGTYNIRESQEHILGISSDEIILMQPHEHILKDRFLWVDRKGKIGYSSLDGSETTLISQGMESQDFFRAALHKDGLLLALLRKDRIQVHNLTHFEEPPTVWYLGHEIDQEGPITDVKFSSNGYWMIVSTANSVMSFDLRKPVGTLAVQPIITDSQLWDTDLSGKNLVIWQSGKLQFYNFVKSSKSWELCKGIEVNELEEPDLRSLKLSYNETGAVTVIQTSSEIQIFTENCS